MECPEAHHVFGNACDKAATQCKKIVETFGLPDRNYARNIIAGDGFLGAGFNRIGSVLRSQGWLNAHLFPKAVSHFLECALKKGHVSLDLLKISIRY